MCRFVFGLFSKEFDLLESMSKFLYWASRDSMIQVQLALNMFVPFFD